MDTALSKFRDLWFCIPQEQKQQRILQRAKPSPGWMSGASYSRQAADWAQVLQRCGSGHTRLSGSSAAPLGAAAWTSVPVWQLLHGEGEEVGPDGIRLKMLLQYRHFLLVVFSIRGS